MSHGKPRKTAAPTPPSRIRQKGRVECKLRVLMDKNGVTALALARRLEVSPQTVWNWTHGISQPRLDLAFRVAKYFGTDPHRIWPKLGMTPKR